MQRALRASSRPPSPHALSEDAGARALPEIGDVVAERYRIERPLARGGMGAVYVAEHMGLARRVALKFLTIDSPDAASRFQREARAAARLESEHVARVLDVGLYGEVPFLAMELLVGVDLCAYLAEHGPLAIGDAVGYVLQACVALAEAHAQGIVHRDLKPSNLFLTYRADGTPLVKLLDFGIAKAPARETWAASNLTGAVQILGSPPYMSPEHLRDASSVDTRTDLWSLGVMLHELVTGRHPFEAATQMHLGARIALEAPTSLRAHAPKAPEALERVIARCLEKEPSARYQSVVELANALAPFNGDLSRVSIDRIERVSMGVASPTVVAVRRPSSRPVQAATSTPARVSGPVSGVVATSPTDRFRRQHDELQKLGMAIAQKLSRKTLAGDAQIVRRMVAQFAGKLAVHASMENEALYPRLLAHGDAKVRESARTLFDEVGAIYGTFADYTRRWPTTESIVADVGGFVTETRELLTVLAFRMVRENDELYPMVEKLER